MHLSPAERLILLKLTHVLELIDPANAAQHNADAQLLVELGTPAGIASMFELIDLMPADIPSPPRPTLRLVTPPNEPFRAGNRVILALSSATMGDEKHLLYTGSVLPNF